MRNYTHTIKLQIHHLKGLCLFSEPQFPFPTGKFCPSARKCSITLWPVRAVGAPAGHETRASLLLFTQ
jgi:hypothetical protein